MRHRLAFLILLLPLWSACGLTEIFWPRGEAEPAVIISDRDTAQIIIPDTVRRGVPFDIQIVSFGGGCVRKLAGTKTAWSGNEFVVRPYNWRTTGDDVCTADLRYLTHTVRLTRDVAGEFVLKVTGLRTSGQFRAEVSVSRTVTVR